MTYDVYVYSQPSHLQAVWIAFRNWLPWWFVGVTTTYGRYQFTNLPEQQHGRRRRRRYYVQRVGHDMTVFLFALLIGCLLGALFEAGQR
jgi:hypothetical protein